jgi:hypothetical protein
MRLLSRITEDEAVLVFLQGEIDSSRFRRMYAPYRRWIEHPSLHDPEQNRRRRALLRAARGYGRDALLFSRWPRDVEWHRAVMTLEELSRTRYASFHSLVQLSEGSRLVADGARNAGQSGTEFDRPVLALTDEVRRGSSYRELILLADERCDDPVLVEGHARATAYVRAGRPPEIEVIVGLSAKPSEWRYY